MKNEMCPLHPNWEKDKCIWCHPEKKKVPFMALPDIKPFLTSNISGETMEVRSRRHRKRLLKKYNLVEYSTNEKSKNRKDITHGKRAAGARPQDFHYGEPRKRNRVYY